MKLYDSDYRTLSEIRDASALCLDGVDHAKRSAIYRLKSGGFVIIASRFNPKYITVRSEYAKITPLGLDALAEKQRTEDELIQQISDKQAEDEARALERAQDKRREFVYFVLGLLLGWLFGLITPVDIWRWFSRTADFIWSMLH